MSNRTEKRKMGHLRHTQQAYYYRMPLAVEPNIVPQ